jgi:hypothetical protein
VKKRKLNVSTRELMKTEQAEPAKKGDDKKGLSAADFQKLVTSQAQDAETYVNDTFSAEREKATDYYKGRLPDVDKDDAEEDRSTVVLSELRDTTLGMMPDLLRIFLGGESICSFKPVPTADAQDYAEREKQAQEETNYVQHVVLKQDNPDSFTTFHDAFQDALVRKTGFIKYWWERKKTPRFYRWVGLSLDQLTATLEGDHYELVSKRAYPATDTAIPGTPTEILYDVRVKCIEDRGRVRIQAFPCENAFFSRKGRSMEHTPLFGYSEEKTLSDFEAMDFSAADLEDCNDESDEDKSETLARKPDSAATEKDDAGSEDPSQKKYKYSEIYITADKDGDGVAELILCICAGTKFKVLRAEPCEDVQVAAFCPYPQAHQLTGDSLYDLTGDIQRIKSRIMRDVLDSLAQSVKPMMTVVEGQVNLDDCLSPDTSPVLRQRAPGMIGTVNIPFVGQDAIPVLDLMDKIREGRTGMSDASQGLDPKVLQSTDKAAVNATLTRSQARIEMVARIFAETGMRRLFHGIHKLIVSNQDVPRPVRIKNKFVTIDASQWGEIDVEVEVPLGRGAPQEQLGFLQTVAAKQEQIIAMLGPDNPICPIEKYFYTLKKILEIAGWQNVESFFGDPASMTPEQKAQMGQAMKQAAGGGQQAPAGPDPATEQAKIASNERIKMAELAQAREEAAAKLQLEGAQMQAEMQMRAIEIQSRSQTTMDVAQIAAATKHASDIIKSQTAVAVERLKPRGGADKKAGDNGNG